MAHEGRHHIVRKEPFFNARALPSRSWDLSLFRQNGSVGAACAAALEIGVSEYRFVRRYLERTPQLRLSLRQIDPLIRQLTVYRDLIDHRSQEKQP